MKLRDIIGELKTMYNPKMAEDWDNVGLLIGDEDKEIKKILFCLDVTENAVEKALKSGVNLIISHHPVIFSGMKRINNETLHARKVLRLIENKIAVYSIHTNADFSVNGLNDFVMEKLDLDGETKILNEVSFEDYNEIKDCLEQHHGGTVRIKILNEGITLENLVKKIKYQLGLPYVRYVGDKDRIVYRVGLVTGGGSSFISQAKGNADVFLTGDLRYHEALDVVEEGGLLVDIGHLESEYLFSDLMEREVSKFFDGEMIKHYENQIFQLG